MPILLSKNIRKKRQDNIAGKYIVLVLRVPWNHFGGLDKIQVSGPHPQRNWVGLRWHPSICISNRSQVRLILLAQGPHFFK